MAEELLILVVDDNVNNLKLAGKALTEKGFKVVHAINGDKAIRLLDKYTPSLILLDIMMPGIDGYEVLKRIKKNPQFREIPVIFLTSKSNTEDIVKGMQLGAVDYITKPFNRNELLTRVQNHIELFIAKKTIRQQAEVLKMANDIKNKIFTIIGHDMRIPLATTQMVLEKLMETDLENKMDYVKKALILIQDSTNQTRMLFNNLINWSKSQIGSNKVVLQVFRLSDVIGRAVSFVAVNLRQKEINVILDVDDEINIYGDIYMIEMVFRNLLMNAIKFSYKNGIIKIEALRRDGNVSVSFIDHGIGLSWEAKASLFNTDYIKSEDGTEGEKGTGIGLWLCKTFVEINNGKIWTVENKGGGCIFNVELPEGVSKSI